MLSGEISGLTSAGAVGIKTSYQWFTIKGLNVLDTLLNMHMAKNSKTLYSKMKNGQVLNPFHCW
jgi:hypothetical protein